MSADSKDQAAPASEPERAVTVAATEGAAEATEGAAEATEGAAEAGEPAASGSATEVEPGAEPEPAAAAEPKTSVQQSEDDDDAVLDASGRERPRFLLGFPPHPELARLAAAFEAGNYAVVRADAEALAERAESPAVRDAARELRRRIEPDPLAKYLLALTAALLLSLAYWAYHH
jgi:hypothetical protein